MKHDPKYNTSLYNHGEICEDGRPLISNEEYMQLVGKVKSGDRLALEVAKAVYNFEPKQLKLLEDIVNNRII